MFRQFYPVVAVFCAAMFLLVSCAEESQKRIATPNEVLSDDLPRTALVIGNSEYESVAPLANPRNDAAAIATALTRAGYRIHSGSAQIDLNREQMNSVVRSFAADVTKSGGIAFIYYAGHGIQVDGQNYLIPVDAKIRKKSDIISQTVDLQDLLIAVSDSNVEMKVVVIDACRDNPFESIASENERGEVQVASVDTDNGLRSISSGLSQIVAPPGSLVAFATAPGTAALDGDGSNSPYAEALINVIGEPDLRVEDVFIAVRNRVSSTTFGKQIPWETSSLTSVASFTGSARTAPTETDIFEELPTTSVWDDRYFSEMRCGANPSTSFSSGPLVKQYYPRIRGGRGQTTQNSAVNETIDFKVFNDGSVQIKGKVRSSSGGGAGIQFSGRMSNGEATMQGSLGDRPCTFTLWRRDAPNNPLNDMRVLSDDQIRELFIGNTTVSNNWSTYFVDSENLVSTVSLHGGNEFLEEEGTWRVKNSMFCDIQGFAYIKGERCWEVRGKEVGGRWSIALLKPDIGRGWVVDLVNGRGSPNLIE